MERFAGLIGFVFILGVAYALSTDRKAIRMKTVFWGLVLQLLTAIAVLKGEPIADSLSVIGPGLGRGTGTAIVVALFLIVPWLAGRMPGNKVAIWSTGGVLLAFTFLRFNLLAFLFETMKDIVNKLIGYTTEGSLFVFGQLGASTTSTGFIFAFQVLPTIIFIASIFAVLYYVGVMQLVVKFFAKIMTRFMGASGAESTSVAASIFMGQTEAPLTIRPFLPKMTNSELMTIMTAGMAHISGGIMAAYVMVAKVDVIHLLTAVIMTAPGAIMMAKIIVPETETPETGGDVEVVVPKQDVNVIDAAGRGAIEGLHLSLNVGAMLIAFIALVALVNGVFGWTHSLIELASVRLIDPFGSMFAALAPVFPSSLDALLGFIFRPVAWAMGVPWSESAMVGNLLGTRMVLNEFVAFVKLGPIADQLSPRAFVITTYALCGFANFSSIAIQIGGIGALAPTRRHDLARLGLRAMIAGTLANFLTATIAGILL
ncbi:MAG: NupC/NupG family nucleoside CNT transporter [Thermoanaerobaculia bacterium]